ncbi:MAG: hypothetical protein ACOZBW_12230 [Thermodesulfobacteriota bacterium]
MLHERLCRHWQDLGVDNLGIFMIKAPKLIEHPVLNVIFILFVIIYTICMFFVPLVCGIFREENWWQYLQGVWHNWQPLNVGILAFISSVIALTISIRKEKIQKHSKWIAARSFLPEALSNLSKYYKECAPVLKEAWARIERHGEHVHKTPLQSPLPQLPESYKEIFSRCIEFSEPNIGKFLALILSRLQINHSRLQALKSYFNENSCTLISKATVLGSIFDLAQLQAMVNRLFNFARGIEEFKDTPLDLQELRTAYYNLDITPDYYEGLLDHTERILRSEED